jgi:VanZ family protein
VAWVPALIWLGLTLYLGSTRRDPLAVVHYELKDKLAHALFFGVMQRTHFRVFEFLRPALGPSRQNLWAFVTATGVGILLEVWQAFLPYRSAEVLDALADAVGAGVVALTFGRQRRR